MALYNVDTINQIVDEYTQGQDFLANVEIDILPQENNIDPLEALRMVQAERSLDNSLKLASAFVAGKKVAFTNGPVVLHEFTAIAGKPLQDYFKEKPYLLSILCSTSWGILLKKLTPPSEGSVSEEGSSVR
jgi:hypothetical protein